MNSLTPDFDENVVRFYLLGIIRNQNTMRLVISVGMRS